MPHRAGDFSMFDTSAGRKNLREKLKQLWTKPSYRRVKVEIPKLKFEHNYENLMSDLKKMGIRDIFDQELADFSRLTTGDYFWFSFKDYRITIKLKMSFF